MLIADQNLAISVDLQHKGCQKLVCHLNGCCEGEVILSVSCWKLHLGGEDSAQRSRLFLVELKVIAE